MLPSVSIVVPTYNAGPALKQTIESCLNQDYPADKLEVIIVDDGSCDGTSSLAAEYPVKYIYQENRGPASARNAGWRAAKGEIICFTDSDCVPERGWVKKLVGGYSSERVGGVGGSYKIGNMGSSLARLIHQEIIWRHGAMPRNAHFLGSFNVSYRKCVLKGVGGFEESFRWASGEDNDLSYRVLKAGYELIFLPHAKVAHLHTEGIRKYLKEQYRHGYWRVKLYTLHPDMMSGDDYSRPKDFIPPVMAPFVIICLATGVFWTPAFYAAAALLGFMMLLTVQMVTAMKGNGDVAQRWLMVWLVFLRAFARGFGLINGVIKFIVGPGLRRWQKGLAVAFSKINTKFVNRN